MMNYIWGKTNEYKGNHLHEDRNISETLYMMSKCWFISAELSLVQGLSVELHIPAMKFI